MWKKTKKSRTREEANNISTRLDDDCCLMRCIMTDRSHVCCINILQVKSEMKTRFSSLFETWKTIKIIHNNNNAIRRMNSMRNGSPIWAAALICVGRLRTMSWTFCLHDPSHSFLLWFGLRTGRLLSQLWAVILLRPFNLPSAPKWIEPLNWWTFLLFSRFNFHLKLTFGEQLRRCRLFLFDY